MHRLPGCHDVESVPDAPGGVSLDVELQSEEGLHGG